MNLFKDCKSLSPKNKNLYGNKNYLPQKMTNKKTLVIDLDETLVHSCFVPFTCPSDIIIQIELENELHDIHVLVRPYVKEFLEKMSEKYELVLFTASISKYANALMNIIDKQGLISFRLFREHCTLINTSFVKDLKKLGRDLKDLIILDNSPFAYALNKDNGLPISTWLFDKNDTELLKIIPILEFLSYVPDVRKYIQKIVKDNQIQFNLVSGVISSYNNKLKNSLIPLSLRFDSFDGIQNRHIAHNGKIIKSCSLKENLIKKFYIDNLKNQNKKNKKKLNITNIDFIARIKGKNIFLNNCKNGNIINNNNSSTNQNNLNNNTNISSLITNNGFNLYKDNVNSIQPTEINRFNYIPLKYESINRMNTMRSNSSTKKIIYIAGKNNKESKNMLKTKIKNFFYVTNKNGLNKNNNHKKNTLSMSQRVGKNSII